MGLVGLWFWPVRLVVLVVFSEIYLDFIAILILGKLSEFERMGLVGCC